MTIIAPTQELSGSSAPAKKLEIVQAFRGIASIGVLLTHCSVIFQDQLGRPFLSNIFAFGGAGVDFFFVLSGFIIFYIHEKDINKPDRFKSFLLKRLSRVYPLYWFVVAVKLISSWGLKGFDLSEVNLSWDFLSSIALLPQKQELLILGVSWTLSFEIFFYLVFGLAILFPRQVVLPMIGAWFVGCAAHLFGLFSIARGTLLADFWLSPLNLEFAMGCYSAYLLRRHRFSSGQALLCGGIFLLTLSIVTDIYTATHGLPSLTKSISVVTYGIPFWLLLMGAITLEFSKPIKVSPLLGEIGNASYSIYLMHGFFLNHLLKVLAKISVSLQYRSLQYNVFLTSGVALVICGLAVLLCYCVYYWIEKPILEFCRKAIA